MSKKTLKDFLKNQILKSGYPLQVKIHSILESKYTVEHNAYFLDEEEKVSRLLDISAMLSPCEVINGTDMLWFKTAPFFLMFNLAIECKKSEEYAWVFFTLPSSTQFSIDGQYVDELQVLSTDPFERGFQIYNHHPDAKVHYNKFKRVASPFVEIKHRKLQKPPQNLKVRSMKSDEIHEGVSELTKFVSFWVNWQMNAWRNSYKTNIEKLQANFGVLYFFPILVFEGKLYEAVVQNNELQLHETNHILLERFYKPTYANYPLSYKIDVVTEDSFPELMKYIDNDILWIQREFSRNSEKFHEIVLSYIEAYKKKAKKY
jgi:hypothetical protein